MKWPRGRYNGRRVVGIELKFRIDLDEWRWLPRWTKYASCLSWGCFFVWAHWSYSYNVDRAEADTTPPYRESAGSFSVNDGKQGRAR